MTAPQLAQGAVLDGKYAVGSILGQGGSAATYHCAAAGNREVIVKIFDPAIRQRADVMAAVQQAYGVVNALPDGASAKIVDAGYDPQSGGPYCVMDRIPLPTLAQVLTQRPLTADEAIAMLKSIARAVDAAHGMKLMHHAIKPTNVFIQFGPPVSARVTDFGAGLARAAVPTQEGYALSAPWIAPEQVNPGMQAGPAADVFSAALLFFFAMTGRSYWRSCQGGKVDFNGWQQEIMSPREPASMRAAALGANLAPTFDVALAQALSPDPNQRPRSLGEFAAMIEGATQPNANASTMAFPAMHQGPGGAYPPPPQPMGGQPGPYGPQGQPPPGHPGQPQYGAQAQAAPPYGAMGGMPGQVGPPQKSASSKAAPIIVGLVVVVLLVGGGAAWFFMGRGEPEAVASAAPEASSAPAAEAAPASDSAEPPPAEPAEKADSGEVEVSVTCDPACEELKVDGKEVEDPSKVLSLKPGKHKLQVGKPGFVTLTETITVEAGNKLEKEFKLTPVPTGGGGAKAPCGKFLKKCK